MAAVDAAEKNKEQHEDHGHDDGHEHAPFIAHHFDDARQQFDSGKLGIWAFLVTEVLFFSGLFVAYALYRYHNPEIYLQAHYFLDTMLGAANTAVLLLSSLTVALAVRAAQLEKHRQVVINITITIACAAFFLGVKAVEYSHKWDMGLFPAGYFSFTGLHHSEEISSYLIILCIPFAIVTLISLLAGVFLWFTDSKLWGSFWLLFSVGMSGFFVGALGGQLYEEHLAPKIDIDAVAAVTGHKIEHDEHDEHGHGDGDESHSDESHNDEGAGQGEASGGDQTEALSADADLPKGPPEYLLPRISSFFSIYYCMTGLHAIHIIAGIVFLSWLLYRSLRQDWRSDFYGPVEYVGLYWHLVDLIWIYLFPLFYLIN